VSITRTVDQRPFLFCLVPREQADALLEPLRAHFAQDPRIAVLVERRRAAGHRPPPDARGVRHWRAPVVERDILRELPPDLHHAAEHVRFVQRLEPVRPTHKDASSAELAEHVRNADADAVTELLWRFSERIRARVRLRLDDATTEQAAMEGALGRILDEFDQYDDAQPLVAWLDAVVDRYAAERAAA